MQRVEAIDIESDLMADGLAAPAMVCMAWSDGESEKLLVPWEGEDPYKRFESILRSGALLVNQHVFFDLAILCNERPHLLPLVFEAIEDGRIRCVKVREQLIRIAAGQAKFIVDDDEATDSEEDEEEVQAVQKTRFDLAAIAKRWLGIELAKADTWRLSYAILRGIPIARWPEDAIEYSVKDTRVALAVWAEQDKFIKDAFPDGVLPGEVEANQAAWALHLMKCWGVRTCPEAVAALTRDLQMKTLWTSIGLIMSGILRKGGTGVKPKAVETKTETQKRITLAFEARGENVPFTKPTANFPDGQVKTAKKVLEDSGDKTLLALAEHKGFMKVLGTYIPRYVAKGIHHPITADWNPLVESFRVSCSRPNLTNPPRVGEVRNCFKARAGFVYVSADFDQAELRSWAQVRLVMFGKCKMAEAFLRDVDPHLVLAASLLGITVEEAIQRYAEGDKQVEEARQFAKQGNFGFGGGMGPPKFAERAALIGMSMTVEKAKWLRDEWMKTWDAKPYLDYFSEHHSEPNTIIHPVTGFYRGECGYSDGANHCVDFETEALTKRGWISGQELLLNDELLTKNIETGKLEWQRPTTINKFPDYSGALYEFDHKAISAVTTPNHRWMVWDRRYGDKCITTQDFVDRANGWWSIHRSGELDASDAAYSDDFLELIGWFLTDGHAEKKAGSTRIHIYQTKPLNVDRIDSLFTRLGIGFRRHQRKAENIYWTFTNAPQNGDGKNLAVALRKLFPERLLTNEFVMGLSRRQARLLVGVMLLGDGTCSDTGQTSFYTKTERGADAFQFLLTLAGYSSRSRLVDRTGEIGRSSPKMLNIPKMGKSWQVHLYRRERSQLRKDQIKQVQGDGRGVWCPSVPNGYFVARRKKKVFVTGNSFQHLTAIGAKQALIDLSRECYTDPKSVLYGARPVIFMHDEIFGEIREEVAAEGAKRWGDVMRMGMEKWIKDVPTKCTPVLTRRLFKGAKPVFVDGVLVPSKPMMIDGKKKWVPDLLETSEMRRAA